MTNDDLKIEYQIHKARLPVFGTSALELRMFEVVPNAYSLSAGQGKETYFPGVQARAAH